jgi:DNA-binding NtrC family response regulator
MGAEITVNGMAVTRSKVAIGGEAAYAARKTATASILAVTDLGSFAAHVGRLRGLYKFRQVESLESARAILEKDRVDVMLVSERVDGDLGLDLIRDVQNRGGDTGCVLMLEPREGATDTAVQTERGLVYCLVKPVGDFALRKAIDDAARFIAKKQKKRFYGEDFGR